MKTHSTVGLVQGSAPWIVVPPILGAVLSGFALGKGLFVLSSCCFALGVVGAIFMAYFHRDPVRIPVGGPNDVVAGADGLVRRVEHIAEDRFFGCETVRISVFLSPFNVHVNRAPMSGEVERLEYTPGRHVLTIRNAASEVNEHSSIFIEGQKTRCLVRQIVGPVVRRVVYWLERGQKIAKGESIGMMRFGSRLDMYFPAADVEILVGKGDKVRAGETIVARIKG